MLDRIAGCLLSLLVASLIPACASAVGPSGDPDAGTDAARPANSTAPVVQLALAAEYSCVRRQDGTVACWGGSAGGSDAADDAPVWLNPRPISVPENVVEISAGGGNACVRLADGSVYCWGGNWSGSIGDGTTVDRLSPTRVEGLSTATQLAVGAGTVCALVEGGFVECWGSNANGQIGVGSDDSGRFERPTRLPSLASITSIAAGQEFMCAIAAPTAAMSCWGINEDGNLGDGTTDVRRSPTPVEGPNDIVRVAPGTQHTCFITRDSTVRCMGLIASPAPNVYGTPHPAPVAGLTDVVQLASGTMFTCALRRDGTVWCWGEGSAGELGGPVPMQAPEYVLGSPVPQRVLGLDGVVEISAGWRHACARRENGEVVCWGANTKGQLGDGTRMSRETPAPVNW